MQISIFPKAKAHPSSKDEKVYNAKLASNPVIVEVEDEETLYDLITSYVWSPSIFSKFRKESDFLHCDVIALDIDDGMTISEAEAICKKHNMMAFIAPSPSYSPEHHKFRIIFPLVTRITVIAVYKATWQYLKAKFPLDLQCSDLARFYFSCLPDPENSIYVDGDMLKSAIPRNLWDNEELLNNQEFVSSDNIADKTTLSLLYGEIPDKINKTVANFFENAHTGMSGEWTCSLNAAIFTLTLMGISDETILSAVQKVSPEPLDGRDMDTIEKAIKDGLKAKLDAQNEDKRREYKDKVKSRENCRVKSKHLI